MISDTSPRTLSSSTPVAIGLVVLLCGGAVGAGQLMGEQSEQKRRVESLEVRTERLIDAMQAQQLKTQSNTEQVAQLVESNRSLQQAVTKLTEQLRRGAR